MTFRPGDRVFVRTTAGELPATVTAAIVNVPDCYEASPDGFDLPLLVGADRLRPLPAAGPCHVAAAAADPSS